MLLSWFDTKELDALADALVAELRQRVPPQVGEHASAKALERATRSFRAMFARIDAFAGSQRLNVYKRAHFANRMRWALKEAGYPADFVGTMTQELLVHLSPPARRGNGR